ncbi:biotin--[acetyl-CoA-carboxylase] ligase [Deinococcus sonorensis]|uniref:biotin--[biotin carboxyl-carrier protein] ligase n=2 Tax=Deinococcus sonorensis TaxID=309891 RepID=A0AAU7UDV8_9DEIO
MPVRLLPLLTDQPQSGLRLAAQLGVNRVSVHTLAHALQAEGYPLSVSRRGYALPAGTPAPQLLQLQGRPYRYLGRCGSTQDELRAWATASPPAPAGAVVLAEQQTAGRGRRGRVWDSSGAGLTFSVLLPGSLTLPQLGLLPLAAGVALHEAAGVGGLKWPNDLLAPDGGKLAGILLEADLRGEELQRAVLGIGLNVHDAPPGAAHLSAFRPGVTRAGVLEVLLGRLDRWLNAPAGEVLDAWRRASVTLGQQVQVQTLAGPVSGLALDLAPDGSLLVQPDHGPPLTISAGDVQLISRKEHP